MWKGPKPTLIWQFTPSPGERIKTVTARPSHDPVASIGKVLEDRNVLYKYLNPNVMLITTLGTQASTATFYILDAASGAVLHSVTHTGVDTDLPIASTMSENWFAYSLFSEINSLSQDVSEIDQPKLRGYQMVVSELYESPYPNDRGAFKASSNYSSIIPTLVDDDGLDESPHVLSQTFLTPGPISSISVTSTLQGITTRSLLCVTPDTNALVSISRAFVDPRRPVGRDATAGEMEEGLFKYSPMLDFEPKWTLSHKRELMSISKAVTSPSLLESTSLVFAFGDVDLFFTRVSPIGAFDQLGKGFSKVQLVLTVVALAIGTTIVAPFVSLKRPCWLSSFLLRVHAEADICTRYGRSRLMEHGRPRSFHQSISEYNLLQIIVDTANCPIPYSLSRGYLKEYFITSSNPFVSSSDSKSSHPLPSLTFTLPYLPLPHIRHLPAS